MSDPRNAARNEKVKQEKEREQPVPAKAAVPDDKETSAPAAATMAAVEEHEKWLRSSRSLTEMEFHSGANIAVLAEVSLRLISKIR